MLLAIELILSGIQLIVSFAGYGESNVCAANTVLFKFIVAVSICIIVMSLAILFGPLNWIQRYSNCPGNIAWVFLFLGYGWSEAFSGKMIAIGVLSLLVCLLSLVSNITTLLKGTTTGIKKLIVVCWVLSLLIMVINEIIAIAAFFAGNEGSFNDVVAKKLLQVFLAVNILEFILWLFGLNTLKYENGDKIRDTLFNFGKEDDIPSRFNESVNEGPSNVNGIGSLVR